MRATQNRPAARPGFVHATASVWQAAGTALDWLDGRRGGPYSPMVCVSTILVIGFIVKFSPALHAILTPH